MSAAMPKNKNRSPNNIRLYLEKITHVGIYSSEGLVYHAKDRARGVVEEPFRIEDWSYWSGLPEYEAQPFPNINPVTENSPLAAYIVLSPNCTEPRNHHITRITPHYMAGNLSVEGCGALFSQSSYKASSNYGIGSDGRVGMYVEEKNRSWASGSPWNDNRAVTIECANLPDGSLTDACWDTLVDLCADICRRNGIRNCTYTGDKDGVLTMHRWFQVTQCPDPWLSEQFERLSREVNAKLNSLTNANKNIEL